MSVLFRACVFLFEMTDLLLRCHTVTVQTIMSASHVWSKITRPIEPDFVSLFERNRKVLKWKFLQIAHTFSSLSNTVRY